MPPVPTEQKPRRVGGWVQRPAPDGEESERESANGRAGDRGWGHARSFVGCGERVRTRDGDVRGGVEGGTKDDDGGQKVVEREREREKE